MKKTVTDLFYGKSTFLNGLLAMSVLGLIVLGCTCNKDMFDQANNTTSNTNTNTGTEKPEPTKPTYEKADASKAEIPSDAELQDMVRADILAFDKALDDENFSDFYDRISEFWQKQTTAAELKKNFQGFIDGNADLSGVKDLQAEFSPEPKLDKSKEKPILEVNGSYPTSPRPSTFELKYIPEGKDWKLIGFFVKTTVYKKT